MRKRGLLINVCFGACVFVAGVMIMAAPKGSVSFATENVAVLGSAAIAATGGAVEQDAKEQQTDEQNTVEQQTDEQNTVEQQTDEQNTVEQQTDGQSAEEQLTEEQKAAKEKEEARLALQNDPNHVHKYKWVAKMNESESAEGTNNYMCVECGKVWFFRPLAPYYAFQGDVAHRIETAPADSTVKVKTSHYINFNSQVMTALAERPDVSVYVSFLDQEYKGNRVSFVIPAGEDAMSLLDQNGYAGFLYLGGKYGLTLEEAMVVPEVIEYTEETAKTE